MTNALAYLLTLLLPTVQLFDLLSHWPSLRRYNLGPNGGILTALNLFTTKFDQVLGFVEKRSESVE